MLTTTKRLLKAYKACQERYNYLFARLNVKYDEPISLVKILEINGLADVIWALRAVPKEQQAERERLARLFACDCAERGLHIFEAEYPDDKRPRKALEVARRYANGQATDEELIAARDAACDAAWAAARDAKWNAIWAALGNARVDPDDAEKQWQAEHFKQMLEREV